MKCSKCKTEIVEGAKYCHQCGMIVMGRIAFIANGKRKKRIENLLVEAMKEIKEEVKNLQGKIKDLEEKQNVPLTFPGSITIPNNDGVVLDGLVTGTGIINTPLTPAIGQPYITYTNDNNNFQFSGGSPDSTSLRINGDTSNSSYFFVSSSSGNLQLDSDQNS